MNETWEEQIEENTNQLQKERDEFEQKAQQEATKVNEANIAWSKALTAVMTTSITNEDIPLDLLKLIIPTPFSSMSDFSIAVVERYSFADSYTGLGHDVSQAPRDDLQMVELLRWSMVDQAPHGIQNQTLDQVVWLEIHLLEEIRVHKRGDAWVLLAFNLLWKMVLSSHWPACCMAAVRLAKLGSQFPMYDKTVWDNFVADLINRYKQLDVDPLGQACLAYLSLTTSNPASTMQQNLPAALAGASFDKKVRIPDLVKLLDSQDVASETEGTIEIVMVRRGHQEVVFSRLQNDTKWDLSVQPISFSSPDAKVRRLTWGPGQSQSVNLAPRSLLWRYLNRHHGTTGVAALNREMIKGGEVILKRLRNLRKVSLSD